MQGGSFTTYTRENKGGKIDESYFGMQRFNQELQQFYCIVKLKPNFGQRDRYIGLLGPNGSGKTTLIKLINGLLVPTDGRILINGLEPSVATRNIVSYLPERTYLSDWMKVKEIVSYFKDFYTNFNETRAYEMLKHLPINPTARLRTLSKGTKEKVQLILVMSRGRRPLCTR